MFCPKCGSEVQEGSSFCGKCGAPVGGAPAEQKPTPGTAAVGAASGAAAKKSGAKVGVIAAAAVVALLAVIGVATNGFGLGGVQPKEAVDVPAAAQGSQAGGEEAPADNGGTGSVDGQDAASDSAQHAAAGAAVKSAVEAYTWDELSQISAEIAAAGDEAAGIEVAKKYSLCTPDGKLDGTQVKSVTLADGTQTTVQIIGFNHDDKTSGGKAGISFIFGDAIAEMPMNSSDTNADGWEASHLRAYLSSDGTSLLPQELAGRIVAVDKLTNNMGLTESVSSVSTTSDQLWLPSATELCSMIAWRGDTNSYEDVLSAEGSEYKLYRDASVDPRAYNDILAKTYNGEACYWWGRSPQPLFSGYFLEVDSYGYPSGSTGASSSIGVVPGFCI